MKQAIYYYLDDAIEGFHISKPVKRGTEAVCIY